MPRTAATPRKRSRITGQRGGNALGGDRSRPSAPGAPRGLRRGMPEYARWEASQILSLGASGLTSEQVCRHLDCTIDEYRERRRWLVENAEPGDGMLAWLEFASRSARRTKEAERAIRQIGRSKTPNQPARAGLLRLLHDIDRDLLTLGFESGVIARFRPNSAVEPNAPGTVPQSSAPAVPELPAGALPPERVDPHGPQYPDRVVLVAALGILVEHGILGGAPTLGGPALVRPPQALAEAARVPPPPA